MPNVSIPIVEDVISSINYTSDAGNITYTFTIEKNTEEHEQPEEYNIGYNIAVTDTDTWGNAAISSITIIVSYDVLGVSDDVNSDEIVLAAAQQTIQTESQGQFIMEPVFPLSRTNNKL